jgi:hypothetical protein
MLHILVAALAELEVVGPTVPESWAAAGRRKLAAARKPARETAMVKNESLV